ncbi:MAG: Glyceraldehyde-3-phosphate dehydrogenase [candidate division TM6 bacterium GW2011_GWF2_43_17]|nr:MAG: Glyceraldehyde-3-phosphate dehydrogenase [candidate division TM6 bacterium GW2011_GWF2_43_17]
MKIAINGLGRIGKTFLRTLLEQSNRVPDIVPVALNIGPACLETLVTTIKYDSIMGPLSKKYEIAFNGTKLQIGSWKIEILQETDPQKLPWQTLGIDWVVEDASKHLAAGARNVLISAPAHEPDYTIIPGVNDQSHLPAYGQIISLGSCTTNAIAPLLKVLLGVISVEAVHLVTTHAYTNTQALLDSIPTTTKDVRKFRAAASNIIPGETGAGNLMGEIFPQLAGKTSALALRVPVANVSLVELTWQSASSINATELLNAYKNAAAKSLAGILDVLVLFGYS